MDRFGVYSNHLKKSAQKPDVPVLIMNDLSDAEKEFEWLSGTVRAVKGLGDRSAYGLPDETGVVVVSIDPLGVLGEADILAGDVIRSINEIAVKSIYDLFTITDKEKWENELQVEIFRNQQVETKVVLLKR